MMALLGSLRSFILTQCPNHCCYLLQINPFMRSQITVEILLVPHPLIRYWKERFSFCLQTIDYCSGGLIRSRQDYALLL